MDVGQKEFLERKYRASEWHGRGARGRRVMKNFTFEGSEFHGWTLIRIQRDERAKPVTVRSLWQHGDSLNELLTVDVFECVSVRAAHDQLIEALGNVESDAVKRRTEKNTLGEVLFELNDTMVLFARVNLVALIRNAGPTVVSIAAFARTLDSLLIRIAGSKPPHSPKSE
jgi:hypothetical protein